MRDIAQDARSRQAAALSIAYALGRPEHVGRGKWRTVCPLHVAGFPSTH